jgi:hypothetical protein
MRKIEAQKWRGRGIYTLAEAPAGVPNQLLILSREAPGSVLTIFPGW